MHKHAMSFKKMKTTATTKDKFKSATASTVRNNMHSSLATQGHWLYYSRSCKTPAPYDIASQINLWADWWINGPVLGVTYGN